MIFAAITTVLAVLLCTGIARLLNNCMGKTDYEELVNYEKKKIGKTLILLKTCSLSHFTLTAV